MKPLRIRIDRITDLGTIVSLKGIETETGEPVSIHIDHRPSASFWEAWRAAGCPEPIEYAADQLILHLDMRPAEDGGEVRLVERDDSSAAANDDRHVIREIEQ
jgi:hypothetical protein